jgi:hypothetical protein
MTNPFNIPKVNAGDPIKAADYNKLVQAATRVIMQPGQFSCGAFTTQRRIGGGNSSSTTTATLSHAMATEDIPAASGDGATLSWTPGILDASATTGGVVMMQWGTDPTDSGYDLEPIRVEGEPLHRIAVNMSKTIIRASTADPILLEGYEEVVGEEVRFIVVSIMDFRSLPGFVGSSKQVPWHDGDDDFSLAHEDCEEVE